MVGEFLNEEAKFAGTEGLPSFADWWGRFQRLGGLKNRDIGVGR